MSSQETLQINRQWQVMPEIDFRCVEDFARYKWQYTREYFPQSKEILEALGMILYDGKRRIERNGEKKFIRRKFDISLVFLSHSLLISFVINFLILFAMKIAI